MSRFPVVLCVLSLCLFCFVLFVVRDVVFSKAAVSDGTYPRCKSKLINLQQVHPPLPRVISYPRSIPRYRGLTMVHRSQSIANLSNFHRPANIPSSILRFGLFQPSNIPRLPRRHGWRLLFLFAHLLSYRLAFVSDRNLVALPFQPVWPRRLHFALCRCFHR